MSINILFSYFSLNLNYVIKVIVRLMCEIKPFPDYPDQIPRFGPLGGCSGVEDNSTAEDLNLNTSSELGNDSSLQVGLYLF